ncbi:uncharacterized protein LOC116618522 [Nematostella vectensis]|uniref:uncharacterized protein LOC116618522 n=1 Tax=Nematostella vectensis TaxID=45351 RepID=UPI00138FBED1|nr:uncharacterized protein LOC116618522 [Nematostella vectensis]
MVTVLRDAVILLMAIPLVTHSSTQESRPLPVVFHSPHIKNQSLEICGPDPSFALSASPKDFKPGQSITITFTITPQEDVLSMVCGAQILLNGLMFLTTYQVNVCAEERAGIKCPLLKGVTYTYSTSHGIEAVRFLPQGRYNIQYQCKDQDDVPILCLSWALSWVF